MIHLAHVAMMCFKVRSWLECGQTDSGILKLYKLYYVRSRERIEVRLSCQEGSGLGTITDVAVGYVTCRVVAVYEMIFCVVREALERMSL